MPTPMKQDVLWLKIPVDISEQVQVLEGDEDLCHIKLNVRLGSGAMLQLFRLMMHICVA